MACKIEGCKNESVGLSLCMKHYQRQRRTGNAFTRNEQREFEKQKLLDDLYEVYSHTKNEEAFTIIGRAIDFVKKG